MLGSRDTKIDIFVEDDRLYHVQWTNPSLCCIAKIDTTTKLAFYNIHLLRALKICHKKIDYLQYAINDQLLHSSCTYFRGLLCFLKELYLLRYAGKVNYIVVRKKKNVDL